MKTCAGRSDRRLEKPKGHNFEKKTEFTDREHRGMSQIGG